MLQGKGALFIILSKFITDLQMFSLMLFDLYCGMIPLYLTFCIVDFGLLAFKIKPCALVLFAFALKYQYTI